MADSLPIATPEISVIIPTWNRATLLRRTLRCLVQQTLASHLYEVIAVDNGSTDETPKVVAEAAFASDQTIRSIYEPILGSS